jgi:hypothetical protein
LASDTYEAPIGFLKEIKASDGHTVTLADDSSAQTEKLKRDYSFYS